MLRRAWGKYSSRYDSNEELQVHVYEGLRWEEIKDIEII